MSTRPWKANRPIPYRRTSLFIRARFPACCALSIRIRCSSIPISSNSSSRCSRASARDSAPLSSLLPGRVIVLQTLEGSPSAKAGLSAGDEIVGINTIPVRYLDVEQLTQVFSEARQKEAVLDVRKPGRDRPVEIKMSPALLDAPTVDRAYMVAPGIGHLRITSFEQPTGELVEQTIEKLGGKSLQGLIIDLRDNPGGAVQSAAETAALFLSPDQLIFTIGGRNAEPEQVAVPKGVKPTPFRSRS